jgi:hypothetical protein
METTPDGSAGMMYADWQFLFLRIHRLHGHPSPGFIDKPSKSLARGSGAGARARRRRQSPRVELCSGASENQARVAELMGEVVLFLQMLGDSL